MSQKGLKKFTFSALGGQSADPERGGGAPKVAKMEAVTIGDSQDLN